MPPKPSTAKRSSLEVNDASASRRRSGSAGSGANRRSGSFDSQQRSSGGNLVNNSQQTGKQTKNNKDKEGGNSPTNAGNNKNDLYNEKQLYPVDCGSLN